MAAEVVVVVQDEDAGLRLVLTVEARGGEAADAPADHDEVVLLLGRALRPGLAGDPGMHGLPGAVVGPAQAGLGGRVVGGQILK